MTDADLIAMARLAQRDERMSTGALYGDLADRIEALGKACTEWAEVSQSNYRRAKAAEAKLAECGARLGKAVEAAEEMSAAFYSNGNVTERHLRTCNAGVKLHATLAEIKGESHE